MKDAEDEAFDELAKRQGMWGGGFHAKRAAAADKLQEPAQSKEFQVIPGIDEAGAEHMAQPAQEPVAWITPDGEGFRIRFSAPTNDVPLGWDALYTTPQQRPWVGLTDEEILKMAYPIRWQEIDDFEADKAVNFAQMVEAKLKEKNT